MLIVPESYDRVYAPDVTSAGTGQDLKDTIQSEESLADISDASAYSSVSRLNTVTSKVVFHLLLAFSSQESILNSPIYYTVYPNAVHFNTVYATRRHELVGLNECNMPSLTLAAYVKDRVYENMIVSLVLTVCLGIVLIYNYASYQECTSQTKEKERIASADFQYSQVSVNPKHWCTQILGVRIRRTLRQCASFTHVNV